MDLEKLDELEKKINQVALLLEKIDFKNERIYEKKCIELLTYNGDLANEYRKIKKWKKTKLK